MSASSKLIVSMLIFGTMGLVVRQVELPVSWIALARGGLGLFFLLLITRVSGRTVSSPAIFRNLKMLAVSGLALGIGWLTLFEAFKRTSIAAATVSYYIAPVLLVMLSPWVLKEKLSPVKTACVVIALAGLVLVAGLLAPAPPGGNSYSGIFFGLAAALCYVVFTLANKFLEGISALDATLAQLSAATAVILPYTILSGGFAASAAGLSDLFWLLILGGVHTAVGFYLFFSALPELKAQNIAVFSYADPVTAVLLSVFVLQEEMTSMAMAGVVMIVGSNLLSELWTRVEKERKEAKTRPERIQAEPL